MTKLNFFKKLTFKHSDEWFEKLTRPTDELSPDERDAVAAHVASCSVCSRIIAENALLERLMQDLPAPDFPEGLSPRLQQLWDEEDGNGKPDEFESITKELME